MTDKTCADCGATIEDGQSAVLREKGKRVCYSCAALREFDDLVRRGQGVLYLTGSELTNWTGIMRFNVRLETFSKHGGGFGSQRTDAWFTGPDGHTWHAINRGDMDLARVRRVQADTYTRLDPRAYQEAMRKALAAHLEG